MITVISGTNRSGSRTLLFAAHFVEQLKALGQDAQLFDLAELRHEFFPRNMYDAGEMAPELLDLQHKFVLGVEKFAIFVPEYNGSYPGVLKMFIDGISVNEYPRNFKNKHVALVGIASGRAGNLRGMDHLGASINHMGGWLLPNKLPLSNVEDLLEDGKLTDSETINALKSHAEQLIAA
ncbi:NAD(P)H-dependent oxidoreductase [Neolewinella aurantiaca]|uniref:NAD(P)H-dependent oxidoreductase n=1 Tax=Neolewinella aurantiaca TaxID=2602767 RepID=A0A5C7FKH7_9BACT|nr:NAD(P)H-dependent oxidoreductase [Neolewinella aurantiaca]TXF90456.1 NAD(P)H-dependent oxidoreductase [Neolewinella aurantiaca]